MALPAFAALAAITLLVVGCGSSSSGVGSGSSQGQSQQQIFKASLENDKASLDHGVLTYTPFSNLQTGDTSSFTVTVTDIGTGPKTVTVTSYRGMVVARQDVPTGGLVGVQVVDCVNLTCNSQSPAKQPVLSRGQEAEWFWNITAGKPGKAEITLRTDTYDQNSSISLADEFIYVNGTVVATPAFNQQQTHQKIANVTKTGINVVETASAIAIATAIVAVGGIIGWLITVRRKRKAAARPHVP